MTTISLIRVTDATEWNRYVASQPGAQFTQAWEWGAFQETQGKLALRLALVQGGEWLCAAQLLYYPKRFGFGYWYIPRGPLVTHTKGESANRLLELFFEALQSERLPKRGVFLRTEPCLESKRDLPILTTLFKRVSSYQPSSTMLIDLTKNEEELLKRMHEKTRYNVRLAERKGVLVRLAETEKDVDAFLAMNEETATRDRFISQPSSYIRSTYEFLRAKSMSVIRLAEIDGDILAGSLEIHFGDTVTYLYGASANHRRNVMAPYALHWQAIIAAKRAKYQHYDLYGTNPEDVTSPSYKSSWEGITRFKVGWGGSRVEYVGTWERSNRPLLYRLLRM